MKKLFSGLPWRAALPTFGMALLSALCAPGASAADTIIKSGAGQYDGIYRITNANGTPGDFVSVHTSESGDSVIATIYRSAGPDKAASFALTDGGASVAALYRWGSWDLYNGALAGNAATIAGYSQYGLCNASVNINFGQTNTIRIAPAGLSDLAPAGTPASACNPSLGYWPALTMQRQWIAPTSDSVDGIYRITNKNGTPGDYLSVHTEAGGGVVATIYRSSTAASAQGFDLSDGGAHVATLYRWGSWDLYSGKLMGNVASLTGYAWYGLCRATGSIVFNNPQTIQITPSGASEFAPSTAQPLCAGAGDGPLPITREYGGPAATGGGAPGPASGYALTVSITGGSGQIGDGASLHCTAAGGVCTANYPANTDVKLTATPDAGYTLAGWGGDCVNAGAAPSVTVTMSKAANCSAAFALNSASAYPLTVTVTGGGKVTDTGAGKITNCTSAGGSACAASYPAGADVTLTATANPGNTFTGWDGDCASAGTNATATIAMSQAASCTAAFQTSAPSTRTLSVNVQGAGTGKVTDGTGAINCTGATGSACSASYPATATVTLTATPGNNSTFTGWGGDCASAGTSLTATIAMSQAASCSATFQPSSPSSYTLSVSVNGTGKVTDGGNISCTTTTGSHCSASYAAGATATLTATATNGNYSFTGWEGDCANAGANATAQVVMNGPASCTARFTLNTPSSYLLTVTNNGGGAVTDGTPPNQKINCTATTGSACAASYGAGTTVTLTATPDTGYTFGGWSGGTCSASASSSITLTMNGIQTCTAKFTPVNYTLNVSVIGGGGTVSYGSPAKSCTSAGGVNCSASYPYHTQVSLSATANAGYTFTGWGGNCGNGTTTPVTVAMDGNRSCSATFTAIPTYALNMTVGTGGTVSATVGGVANGISNCSASGGTCSANYSDGTSVRLTATPAQYYAFSGWSGGTCSTSTNSSITLTMSQARSCTATFKATAYPLTVIAGNNGRVTSSPAGISNCTSTGGTCDAYFNASSSVSLTATPSSGYTVAWGGDCTGTANTTSVAMGTAAKNCTVNFTQITYALTVTNAGGGTVTSSPSGINCGSSCSATYNSGASVTLTAAPDSTHTFAGWSGSNCSTSTNSSITLAMSQARSCTATFNAIPTYTLSVTNAGGGTVTSNTGGINCGSNCSATYNSGTSVTLTATPATGGYTFAGWSGSNCSTSTNSSITLTMSQSRSCTATFNAPVPTYALGVKVTGASGSGSVSSNPAGINSCAASSSGNTCNASYNSGTNVTLTATPGNGYKVAWGGACSSTTNTASVAMTAAKNCTADFTPITYTLGVTISGNGSVSSNPGGINNCASGTCNASFNSGTNVTLTATAANGNSFTGWSGSTCGSTSTNSSITLAMSQARSCTATFNAIPTYTLSVTNAGGGTVTSNTGGINCGSTCSATYTSGTSVILTATPASGGYTFAGWSGASCSGSSTTATVSMTANRSCTATFNAPPPTTYALSVKVTGASGSGSVSSNPAGINSCAASSGGTSCSANYSSGTSVTLTAMPASGNSVTWSGNCASTGTNTTSVTMTGAQTCNASFSASGMRDITAMAAVHEIGVGWNLGNTFDADPTWYTTGDPEPAWVNIMTTQAMIDKVADAGFTGIRIPVTWDTGVGTYHRIGAAPGYTLRSAFVDRLKTVISWAQARNMYIILNVHHDDLDWMTFKNAGYSTESAKLKQLWTNIANAFKDYDEKLIFETLNEPTCTDANGSTYWSAPPAECTSNVNKLNQDALNAIRATGSNNAKRFVMVPPYNADGTTTAIVNAFTLPTDTATSKLIVSIHYYFPHDFAMYLPADSSTATPTWGSTADKTAMDNMFSTINTKFTSKNIPVIMGEFGAINKNNESQRAAWATYYVAGAKKYGIAPFVWDNDSFTANASSTYGILNRQATPPSFQFPLYLQGLMNGLN